MTHQAFNVYLNGRCIDTVFATGYDCDEMRRSLINHDGYDAGIVVKHRRTGHTPNYAPAKQTRKARGQ